MRFLILIALVASTQALSFDDVLGKLKEEFGHLKDIVAKIEAGGSVLDILKDIESNHPGIQKRLNQVCAIQILQQVDFVAKACKAIGAGAAPVSPSATRKFNFGHFLDGVLSFGPFAAFKTEVDKIKQLVAVIKQHKTPQEIVQAVIGLGLQDKIISICHLDALKQVAVVQQVCGVIEPIGNLIDAAAPPAAAPADAPAVPVVASPKTKRHFNFGHFFEGLLSSGPLSAFKTDVDHVKQLVEVIKQHKTPQEIVQAVIGLGLQDKIVALCKNDALQAIAPVQTACNLVGPALSLLGAAAPAAPAAPAASP